MAGKEFKDPIDLAYAGLSKEAKAQWDQIDKSVAMLREKPLQGPPTRRKCTRLPTCGRAAGQGSMPV